VDSHPGSFCRTFQRSGLGYDGLVYGESAKKPLDLKVVKSGQK